MNKEHFFKIDGGFGRCLASTGAIAKFAQNHKTSVITSFPDAFKGLKELERIYPIGSSPFLYEDKIKFGVYSDPEPYNEYDYYSEQKHISHVFNKLINGIDEPISPILRLTENELLSGKSFVEGGRGGKGFILMQPFGLKGGYTTGDKIKIDESYRSFDFDFAAVLTDTLIEAGYQVVWLKKPDQVGYSKALQFPANIPLRQMLACIPYCDGVIGCDSMVNHASAALGTPVPTVVLWGGSNPKNLAYEAHTNFINPTEYYEPNRIDHESTFYLDKNEGINKFPLEWIPQIVDKMKAPPLQQLQPTLTTCCENRKFAESCSKYEFKPVPVNELDGLNCMEIMEKLKLAQLTQ